jgi:hypothetical protein
VPAALVAAFAVTACTLLTSLDGLSDSADGGGDDAGRDALVTLPDGAVVSKDDAAAIDGGDAAKVDAAPSPSDLYAAAVLADKPLGYWRLEETSGSVAKDETGRNDGKYVNAPVLGEPGIAGSRAMKLPAQLSAYMTVATGNFRFPGTTPYTVELWVKPGVFRNYEWIATTELWDPARHGWSVLVDQAGILRYEVWTTDGDGGSNQVRGLAVSATPITAGTFRHVVLAYTGSTAVGYVDGINTTNFDTTGAGQDTGTLFFGCLSNVSGCLDDWVIDELAIYDFALTGARAKAHYDLGK